MLRRVSTHAPTSEPIVAETVVPVETTAAFVGFTAQMGEWWDPMFTPDPATFQSIEIDPDGDVAMVHEQEKFVWGRVTEWDPTSHYAQEFWLGHSPEHPSQLRVTFTEDEPGTTRVRVEHGGWGEGNADARARYDGWDGLLQRYAAHVS